VGWDSHELPWDETEKFPMDKPAELFHRGIDIYIAFCQMRLCWIEQFWKPHGQCSHSLIVDQTCKNSQQCWSAKKKNIGYDNENLEKYLSNCGW